jgi:hypothetical protein
MSRFSHIPYDSESQIISDHLKFLFELVEKQVDELEPCREKHMIYTKLEEAFMWVGKAIKNQQILREIGQENAD